MPLAEINFHQGSSDPWLLWIQIGGVIITAIAAIAACFSARAAYATVREAEATRKMRQKPWLTIEPKFLSASIEFPRQNSPIITPLIVSDNKNEGPVFYINNIGEGPAIRVVVTFELHDTCEDYSVPDQFKRVGNSDDRIDLLIRDESNLVRFNRGVQGGEAWYLLKKSAVILPLIRPGQAKYVRLPNEILALIGVRGMQISTNEGDHKHLPRENDLSITVEYAGKEFPIIIEKIWLSVTPRAGRVKTMEDVVLYQFMGGGFTQRVDGPN